jgi:hypothetical protein
LLVAHNQIQLALFATVVPANWFQPFADQKIMGLVFRAFAAQ